MKRPRYRALVLLATFASLRWGEAIALRRADIDLDRRTVTVRRRYTELADQLVLGPPKSRAGYRTVVIPPSVVSELGDHLAAYVGPPGADLVFTGQLGGILRRGNFRRDSGWPAAVSKLGITGLHFHDRDSPAVTKRSGTQRARPAGLGAE
jgi:integrase